MKVPALVLAGVCLCFSSSVYAWYRPPWNSWSGKGVDAHVTMPIKKPDGIQRQDSFKQKIGRIDTGVSIYPTSFKKINGYTRLSLGDLFGSFGSQTVININW